MGVCVCNTLDVFVRLVGWLAGWLVVYVCASAAAVVFVVAGACLSFWMCAYVCKQILLGVDFKLMFLLCS